MDEAIRQSGKSKLAAVINASGDVLRIADVETTLTVSRTKAAKLLSRWASKACSGESVLGPTCRSSSRFANPSRSSMTRGF